MSNPDSHGVPQSKQPSKGGGIFSWARPRGRTKSKASIPDPSLRSAPVLPLPSTDSSFNLRSFRTITSPTPESTPPSNSPPSKSPIPRPHRPREDSFASDASQRISVAAFREAQARRSTTDSPVPSSSGDRDSFASGQIRNRKISSALGTPPSASSPAPQPRRLVSRSPPTRSSTAPLSFAASMTTSDSSEEEESESEEDDEEEATVRLGRKRTVTSRSARSELGHRSPPKSSISASRSDIGHGLSSGLTSRPSPIPRVARNSPGLEASGKGNRTSSVYSHARASVSTSALGSDAAANRASVVTKYSAGSFFIVSLLVRLQTPQSASRPTQRPQGSRSRASTSSEDSSSSYSSDSEDAPLSSLIPPQRPGSGMSRASGSPVRRPAKPLIDIEQLVGENPALPPRTSEPSSDPPSQPAPEVDSSPARFRKTSLGLGERFSALTSGFSGLQPSRSKSPEASDTKDEAFTPPEIPEKPPHPSRPQSPIPSPPLPSPISSAKPASPTFRAKASKSSLALRLKSSGTPRLNTSSLNLDSAMSPPPSSSTSSDAPIPHITPTPIRAREEPPAFAVTSRPTSHASNLSIGTLPTVDKPVAAADYKSAPRGAVPSAADKPKQDQQQQRRPPQEQSQSTTVRVVRSVVPLKSSADDPLPIPRPRSRPHLPSVGVTVSNVHLTPPSSSASNSSSALRESSGSGVVLPPRRPFALRDSSPASSAGDSTSSRMPITPRDGSDLGVSSTGRPGVGHRKRASVTFVDELEDDRSAREKERNSRRISESSRSSHGHGHAVTPDSSDDEDTTRGRERKAEEKRKERRRTEAKAAIEVRLL
jgi:hypothetical protein